MRYWRALELEWKILLAAALLLISLAVPVQRSLSHQMDDTLHQSLDSNLETLLRQGYVASDSANKEAWLASFERNRQWRAMIPIILEEQRRTVIIFSVAIFLTGLLFALWTLKRLTRPLKELAAAAGDIGHGSKTVITVRSGGALGRLEASMSTMQDELLVLREKLLSQGMEQAWRDIARVMAHEIKNPLTPIRLTLDRMEENRQLGKPLNTEDQKKFEERIASQVEQLERLVTAFGSFAKEPEVRLKTVQLNDFLKTASEPMCDRIVCEVRGTGEISADPYLMNQVVLNILKNGAEAGATVMITDIQSQGANVRIRMTDNGPGVDKERLEKLFIPYVTYKPGGTGLGLPIVKRLVQAMKGSVKLESSANNGLTVVLEFPAGNGGNA